MNDNINIDENHIYRLGTRRLPSVTQAIQANFGERLTEWHVGERFYWTEWHAGKGTAVHKAIHYLLEGVLDWGTVDVRILGKLKAFVKFISETGYEVMHSELMLHSKRYQFAGTIDLILHNDHLILGDIKSSLEPYVEIQLGGYSLLWEEKYNSKIKKACAIVLGDNGTYSLKWYKNIKQAQRLFLACLTIANFKTLHYDKT
jgi:hypothetical protein